LTNIWQLRGEVLEWRTMFLLTPQYAKFHLEPAFLLLQATGSAGYQGHII